MLNNNKNRWLFNYITVLFFILVYINNSFAKPWFVGPIISNSSIVESIGQEQLILRFDNANSYGIYDSGDNFISTPRTSIDSLLANFTYGLADDVDAGINLVYLKNQNEGQSLADLGDIMITLGFQVSRQANSRYLPDFRITLQEIFPTGRYQNLNPDLYGVDATGAGSYQSMITFNFSRLSELSNNHFISVHGSFGLNYPSSVPINGFSIYGGSTTTSGSLSLGKSFFADLAAEYNLSQRWAAVIETFIFAQQRSSFTGQISDKGPGGALPRFEFSGDGSQPPNAEANVRPLVARRFLRRIIFNQLIPSHLNLGQRDIGNGNNVLFTLAPAIEYSISENLGFVGGAWFSISGKNTPEFMTSVIMVVAKW